MDDNDRTAYRVPRYRAPDDTSFYHVLHGTVPGHQIDFMYCPEVPQGALAQTHFGHLSRLMRYIEARQGADFGFAIGNLSRDDVQHEPGHGGLAILFALRVPGVTDHAGRDMPPYAHGIVAVDRSLEYVQLVQAIVRLHKRFIERDGAAEQRGDFYRTYVRIMSEQPELAQAFLDAAIAQIEDIPHPDKSRLGFDFEVDPDAHSLPPRIYIVHDDAEPFSTLAHVSAQIGSALYRSNVKWTSITTGREIDIPGGTSVRFLPESEALTVREPTYRIDDLPDDEGELLLRLFGAKRRVPKVAARRRGWREALAERPGTSRSERPPSFGGATSDSQDSGDIDVEIDDAAATLVVEPSHEEAPRTPRPKSVAPSPSSAPASAEMPRAEIVRAPSAAVHNVRSAPPSTPVGARLTLQHESYSSSTGSASTHLERPFASRSARGRWIIAAAAFAAITVIVIVSVVAGIGLQEAEHQEHSGPTGSFE